MLNIGMTELLIFGIIALLVLGPDKLPEAVRFVGTWYGKIKRMVSNVQNDLLATSTWEHVCTWRKTLYSTSRFPM